MVEVGEVLVVGSGLGGVVGVVEVEVVWVMFVGMNPLCINPGAVHCTYTDQKPLCVCPMTSYA